MDRVSFFEFSTPDPQKEIDFFKEVFGWTIAQWGDQKYWLVTTGPTDKLGIDGAIQPPPMDNAPRVVNTITVDDVDASIERAKSAGATVVVEKTEVPKTGWLAYLVSPTGIPFGMIQRMPGDMM
jgi:predicted enzyme related to lactoylglutathione lyase